MIIYLDLLLHSSILLVDVIESYTHAIQQIQIQFQPITIGIEYKRSRRLLLFGIPNTISTLIRSLPLLAV